jgi:hypothetical protein
MPTIGLVSSRPLLALVGSSSWNSGWVMRDVTVPADRRDEMAKAAAPYVHPKLAPARQEGFYDLSRLSDQELQAFEFLTLKAFGEPKPV